MFHVSATQITSLVQEYPLEYIQILITHRNKVKYIVDEICVYKWNQYMLHGWQECFFQFWTP